MLPCVNWSPAFAKAFAYVLAVMLNLLLRAGGAEPSEASFNHQ